MKKTKIVLLVGVLMLLTACTTIPLGTMLKMVKLNPLDMDPQQVVIAVTTPQGLKVRDGDVVIDFSFHHQFPVMVNDQYVVPDRLKRNLRENESITVMQLSAEDAFAMQNAQQVVKEYRQNDGSGAGNIDVQLVSACRDNDFSWRDSKLNLYLKTKDEEPFFLLFRNIDVTQLNDDIQRDLNMLPGCADAS